MTRLLTVLTIAMTTTAAHAGLITSDRYAKTEPPLLDQSRARAVGCCGA